MQFPNLKRLLTVDKLDDAERSELEQLLILFDARGELIKEAGKRNVESSKTIKELLSILRRP